MEGLETVKTARELSLIHDVQMPITDVVYRILYKGLSVSEGLSEMMSRKRKPEREPFFKPEMCIRDRAKSHLKWCFS